MVQNSQTSKVHIIKTNAMKLMKENKQRFTNRNKLMSNQIIEYKPAIKLKEIKNREDQ